MKMSLKRFLLTGFVVFLSTIEIAAQQNPEAKAPTGSALEIVYYNGLAPAYQSVSATGSGGGWFAKFRRLPNFQPKDDSLPVNAVNIVSRREGDAVRVFLSVFLGKTFHEKEEAVASYLLQDEQRVIANELTRYGVEPFEIALIKIAPIAPVIPAIVNLTTSLEVTGLEANPTTLPSYTLSLKNRSGKDISAVHFDIYVGDILRLGKRELEKEGVPLIKSGEGFQTNILGVRDVVKSAQGFKPESPQGQSLHVVCVVFQDGTYEGDPKTAATIRARTVGHKAQLSQVITFLENSLKDDDLDTATAIERFRILATSLEEDVNSTNIESLIKEFPEPVLAARSNIKASLQFAQHQIKKDLLDSLDQFKSSHPSGSNRNSFRVWLHTQKARYQQWLSLL